MASHDLASSAAIAALVVALVVLMVVEIKILRARRAKRLKRLDLPDKAHNAIVTTKAIGVTLARGGVRSAEADGLLREADQAYRRRNYRVAMELADRARTVLLAAKARHGARGDAAKLGPPPSKAEPTTKEKLQKELPENFLQSKFSLRVARDAVASSQRDGRDVADARAYLDRAEASFEAREYTEALRYAVLSRKVAEGTLPPVEAPSGTTHCPECGTAVAADDAFCRKCGARLAA
jgi:hypothetical protein